MHTKEILQIQTRIKKTEVLNVFQSYSTLMRGMYRLVEHLFVQYELSIHSDIFKSVIKELPNELKKENLKQTLFLIILVQQCLIHVFNEMSPEFKITYVKKNNLAIKTLKQIYKILFQQLNTTSIS